jgi:hypothetical protein
MSDGPMIGRLRLSTFVVSEARDTVFDGSQREENPLDERTSITVPIVMLDYRLLSRLGMQASTAIPLIARTGVVQRTTGSSTFRDEVRGLGYTVVSAWYRGGTPMRWSWTMSGGASLPTGKSRTPRFRSELSEGSLVPLSRLQRGSGTLDPVFGFSAERPLQGGRWVSSLAMRTPIGENAHGLRVGASSELGTGWAHPIRSHRVLAYGRVDWLHRRQDVFRGTPVLVGGGHWLYATPGIALMVGKGLNLQADVKLPLHRQLANRQLDSHAIWTFGLSRSF